MAGPRCRDGGHCQTESRALVMWPGMLFPKSRGLSNCGEQLARALFYMRAQASLLQGVPVECGLNLCLTPLTGNRSGSGAREVNYPFQFATDDGRIGPNTITSASECVRVNASLCQCICTVTVRNSL